MWENPFGPKHALSVVVDQVVVQNWEYIVSVVWSKGYSLEYQVATAVSQALFGVFTSLFSISPTRVIHSALRTNDVYFSAFSIWLSS